MNFSKNSDILKITETKLGGKCYMKKRHEKVSNSSNIHRKIFTVQLILIISLALFLGIAGTLININFETRKRDQNLQNVAETIAQSPLLDIEFKKRAGDIDVLSEYLDSLKNVLVHYHCHQRYSTLINYVHNSFYLY